jgi:hypothetical protein
MANEVDRSQSWPKERLAGLLGYWLARERHAGDIKGAYMEANLWAKRIKDRYGCEYDLGLVAARMRKLLASSARDEELKREQIEIKQFRFAKRKDPAIIEREQLRKAMERPETASLGEVMASLRVLGEKGGTESSETRWAAEWLRAQGIPA